MDSNVSSAIAPAPSKSSPWIPFSERMPEPPHGKILVTSDITAIDADGKKSQTWLISRVYGNGGDVVIYDRSDSYLVTHWRPAFPEEWPELREPKSEPKVCVYNEAGGPV